MPKIQEVRTVISIRSGRKVYSKHVIVIPTWVVKVLHWERGDEIIFHLDKEDLINGFVKIKKIGVR